MASTFPVRCFTLAMLAVSVFSSQDFSASRQSTAAWVNAPVFTPSANTLRSASHPSSSLIGISMAAKPISRRDMGGILAGALIGQSALFLSPTAAFARGPVPDFLKDGEVGYTQAANGVRFKDVKDGLGSAPQTGDRVRIQFSAYSKDGTLVSRGEGVEFKLMLGLGGQEFPAGLDAGLAGMKVGGERIVVIPPEQGWTYKFRASSLPIMRGCEKEDACLLTGGDVVLRVFMRAYQKGNCAAGDMPISMDASSLMKDGKVQFKFGSDTCPEGDTEITVERLKTRALIDGLKNSGKLKAEERQKGLFD